MSSCKLTYFDSQALAEAIRFLLHYGKIQFEDIRLNFEKDWPAYPKDTLPLRQLPILEIDGKVFYQTIAICRYLAKKVGLAGSTPLEDYEIDNAVDNVNDFRARLAGAFYEQNAVAKEEKMKIALNETVPFFLGKLEAIAQQNDGHFALKRFTWADVYFTGMHRYLARLVGSEDLTANYPNLRKVVENTESTSGIKEWVARRPDTFY
ncbi:glutathione S-transferase-like [Bradysia coprophila]|uniref:glutathione S-transferase-like n=1 Tax=Bradysia coprophila TaxID=38358 RepID=UPI00187DA760|nr:glutathione S-transferase-like [Bradysia coprophila]